MDIKDKLSILAQGAKYDVSCASSGSQGRKGKGVGSTAASGICHTWSADGRCISLLKVLMSNVCVYDCAYCWCRRSNDIPRAMFTVEEICQLTLSFYRRNYIEGLFLSSAVTRNPDFTMEGLVRVLRTLRNQMVFRGYIHLKLIPGASRPLIDEAGLLADRVSINIELPSEQSLTRLAPEKTVSSIITPMRDVSSSISTSKAERKTTRRAPRFAPAGQSTQMIIGASPESDQQIMNVSSWLYKKMSLRRVYYSAYVPVNESRFQAPEVVNPPLLREHRLYQADWLLRIYGFGLEEIFDPNHPNLDYSVDPKTSWALRNFGLFPVDLTRADYEMILRIPGIGVRSAQKIVSLRRQKRLTVEDLKTSGVSLKRAQHFLTVNGYRPSTKQSRPDRIRTLVSAPAADGVQLDLFRQPDPVLAAAKTGEF